MKLFLKIIYWVVSIVVVLVAFFVILTAIPIPGNFRMYVVRSGSMAPAIKTGSLIIIKPQTDYQVGQIVTFLPSGAKNKSDTVTHRIVDVTEENGVKVIETKGDANNTSDGEKTPVSGIIGKEIFKIPYLGYPIGFAKTLPGLILLVIVPGTIIVYGEVLNIVKEIKKRKKNKNKLEKKKELNIVRGGRQKAADEN